MNRCVIFCNKEKWYTILRKFSNIISFGYLVHLLQLSTILCFADNFYVKSPYKKFPISQVLHN